VVKWAREHGCPWGKLTCAAARRAEEKGHPEVLHWLREHGSDYFEMYPER